MKIRKRLDRPFTTRYFIGPVKDGEVQVFCRIFHNRLKAEAKTPIKGDVKDWDVEKGRFLEKNRYNEYANKQLDAFGEEIYKAYLKLKGTGAKITAQGIKQMFLGNESFHEDDSPTLLEYAKLHYERVSKLKEDYTEGTLLHYKTLFKYLRNYLVSEKIQGIKLKDLKRKHIIGFQLYLGTEITTIYGDTLKKVTVNKYLAKLKAVINHALVEELIVSNPFAGFIMKRPKPVNRYLTKDELDRLINCSLDGNKALEKVRAMFIMATYTGLRFSDLMALRKDSITKGEDGRYYMNRVLQKKTGSVIVKLPLNNYAVKLYHEFIEKYPNGPRLIPGITNQSTNTMLKTIAALANINTTLTFHCSRHTYATIILAQGGVDIKSASVLLGHSKISSTEVYYSVTAERLNDVIDRINVNQKAIA